MNYAMDLWIAQDPSRLRDRAEDRTCTCASRAERPAPTARGMAQAEKRHPTTELRSRARLPRAWVPNRDALESFLRAHADEEYVTSAVVYQEIVHRYVAIDGRQAIVDCFRLLDALVRQVHSITRQDVERAHEVCLLQRRLLGRDCLHIATMERFGLRQVVTFDRDFELWPGLSCVP